MTSRYHQVEVYQVGDKILKTLEKLNLLLHEKLFLYKVSSDVFEPHFETVRTFSVFIHLVSSLINFELRLLKNRLVYLI